MSASPKRLCCHEPSGSERDSTVQRKNLAQKTKDFKKLDDANKLVEFKSLLKGGVVLLAFIAPQLASLRTPRPVSCQLTARPSLPNIHRSPHKPHQVCKLCLLTDLHVPV